MKITILPTMFQSYGTDQFFLVPGVIMPGEFKGGHTLKFKSFKKEAEAYGSKQAENAYAELMDEAKPYPDLEKLPPSYWRVSTKNAGETAWVGNLYLRKDGIVGYLTEYYTKKGEKGIMADTSRKTGHEVNVAYEKPVFTFSERTVLTEDLEATLDDLLGGLL